MRAVSANIESDPFFGEGDERISKAPFTKRHVSLVDWKHFHFFVVAENKNTSNHNEPRESCVRELYTV